MTKDDLISRQALLDDIEELKKSPWFNDDNYFAIRKDALSCVVDLCIKKAPSAQQWITCSERLPDQNGTYLVIGRQKAINILKFDGGRWYGKWGVVAWMPLPSPYREETES